MNKKITSQVLKEVFEDFTNLEVGGNYNKHIRKLFQKAISRTIELMENEQKPFIKKLGKSAVEWMRGYNQLEDDCKKFWAKNIELNKKLRKQKTNFKNMIKEIFKEEFGKNSSKSYLQKVIESKIKEMENLE